MRRIWQAFIVACVIYVSICDAAQTSGKKGKRKLNLPDTNTDMSARRTTRAGTWYADNAPILNQQLQTWLDQAPVLHSPARAIIAPHAGYRACGACSAFAYRQIDPTNVKRLFILAPSHRGRVSGCGLSSCSTYKNPLYDLTIDKQVYEHLNATGSFETFSRSIDEKEHSIEMQLPYIAKVMEKYEGSFTIVPVLVGRLNLTRQQEYGEIFAPYLANPENLFVISSDFWHWGKKFNYTYHDPAYGEIYQFIEHLDRMAMDLIENLDPVGFANEPELRGKTICGRNAIGILLYAVNTLRRNTANELKPTLRFLNYAQNRRCTSMNDTCVSYACGALTMQ
ncbi:PREDICTED: protein MEMO1-like [Priapulus caudatus]|uniref:Protein MEMO1-like n=1 Tax=Priapulus caudatus TaxID=37621 RepID=A0ABM1EL06_PRICU|nr:PREDICTED: protein MEMO1-like [Priapulus caudatus]